MYVNGMGIRGISRVAGVSHTIILQWIKAVGEGLPMAYDPDELPEVGELDEVKTFVGNKKNKVWLWTSVEHFRPGILSWVVGDARSVPTDRSSETFNILWQMIEWWRCYFWVSDGYVVYPKFIPPGDQIVSKTYMTRVEGENTRLRHYLARLHRKTLCYSKSQNMLSHSIRLLVHYLKFWEVPVPA